MASSSNLSLSRAFPAWCVWALLHALGTTWRYRFTGDQTWNPSVSEVHGTIFCFWHATLLHFAHGFRGCGVVTVVSASKDGDIAAFIASHWRHETIRGSSSRKGMAAAMQCIAALQNKKNIALIPDGPRGPLRKAKNGTAHVAILSGAPIVSVPTTVSSSWYLSSWDRFSIPKPGAQITFHFQPPILTQGLQATDAEVERVTGELQKGLDSCK